LASCARLYTMPQNLPSFTARPIHQPVEDFQVRRTPGFDEVVDVRSERFVNFDSSRSGVRIRDSFAPDVFANVEGFASQVPIARLAQWWEHFLLIFKLRHQ
jgi:hypothetical protein